MYKLIGHNIKNIRISKGISQEMLAEKCNLSISMIQKAESGKAILSLSKFIAVLNALEISADTLISSDQKHLALAARREREIAHVLYMVEYFLRGKELPLTAGIGNGTLSIEHKNI